MPTRKAKIVKIGTIDRTRKGGWILRNWTFDWTDVDEEYRSGLDRKANGMWTYAGYTFSELADLSVLSSISSLTIE